MFKRIVNLYKVSVRFITHDIWHLGSERLSGSDAFLVRVLKVLIVSIRSFWEDRISIRASALTLYTVLTIVPIVAIVFTVAKGFSIDSQLQYFLMENFSDHQDIVTWVMEFADNALKNARGGVLAGVGIVVLLWSVISMLSNVESSFNYIWNVTTPRSWVRRLSNYISMMIIVPIILVIVSSLSVSFMFKMDALEEAYPFLQTIGWFVRFLLKLLPYLLMGLMLVAVYMVMPNTKVRFKAALIGGLVAGAILVLAQTLYLYSQVRISKYSAIYGSLAAIPLFLLWAKTSWLIVLFGAELSFAFQNIDSYDHENSSNRMSISDRIILSLVITRMLANNFAQGNPALTDEDISLKSSIPVRAVRMILRDLVGVGIVSEVLITNDKDLAYQPAVDIHLLTVGYVQSRVEKLESNPFVVPQDTTGDRFVYILNKQRETFEKSDSNQLLIDL
ncbi:MAG: YihY/virulence factor BrkB family protein [Prevotellaceae bacterium]|jgi:membrane protein|nr:YihY/virulence factor BrkB family protein [Prevotellaceae bacterium]